MAKKGLVGVTSGWIPTSRVASAKFRGRVARVPRRDVEPLTLCWVQIRKGRERGARSRRQGGAAAGAGRAARAKASWLSYGR